MADNSALKLFGRILQFIYEFMCETIIPVFGFNIPLWGIFLFGLMGGVVVWFIKKIFG